jgi:hypothetical protein
MIGGDDPAPWRLLADGTIVALERTGDVVAVTVERHPHRVRLLLAGCDSVSYEPHDEPMLYDLDAIAASQPDIRDARWEPGAKAGRAQGAMMVTGGAGTLRLAYANVVVELAGARVELGELARRLSR